MSFGMNIPSLSRAAEWKHFGILIVKVKFRYKELKKEDQWKCSRVPSKNFVSQSTQARVTQIDVMGVAAHVPPNSLARVASKLSTALPS